MIQRLKQWAKRLKREAHALYLAARDPRVPWYAKALALGIAAYAFSPIDLIPDFIPVFGLLDDLVLLPLAIALAVKLIPAEVLEEHRATAARAEGRPVSRNAAIAIVCLWLASAVGAGWLVHRMFV